MIVYKKNFHGAIEIIYNGEMAELVRLLSKTPLIDKYQIWQ